MEFMFSVTVLGTIETSATLKVADKGPNVFSHNSKYLVEVVQFIEITKVFVVLRSRKFLLTNKSLITLMTYFFNSSFGFPESIRIFEKFVLLAFLMIYSTVANKYTQLDTLYVYILFLETLKYLGKHRKYEKICECVRY